MTRKLLTLLALAALAACANALDMESGEVKALKLLKKKLDAPSGPVAYVDARKLVTRQMIDAAGVPVLFVEIDRGQNGTMTQFPGVGVGETWLGSDGSTVTLERGMLKATRGVGDDLMGSETSREISWGDLDPAPYTRSLAHLREDNQTHIEEFTCTLTDARESHTLELFGATFTAKLFRETCQGAATHFTNTYYVDASGIVRKSRLYHGEGIGYMTLERLDR